MRQTFANSRQAFLFGQKFVQSPGRQVDWDSVPERFRQGTVKVALQASALANATTISVIIAAGTVVYAGQLIDFGGTKFARVAANATGTGSAQNVTTDALPTALTGDETGYISGSGPKFIPAGTVMAQLSSGKVAPLAVVAGTYDASSAAQASNTGNGVLTLANPKTDSAVQEGVYTVTITAAATNGGSFEVEGPDGVVVGTGVVGSAFAEQVRFTLADGTSDFVVGDQFYITVTGTNAEAAGLIITDASSDSLTDATTGYGIVISGVVFENLLPDSVAGVLPAAIKSKLVDLYGGGWKFETYADTRS